MNSWSASNLKNKANGTKLWQPWLLWQELTSGLTTASCFSENPKKYHVHCHTWVELMLVTGLRVNNADFLRTCASTKETLNPNLRYYPGDTIIMLLQLLIIRCIYLAYSYTPFILICIACIADKYYSNSSVHLSVVFWHELNYLISKKSIVFASRQLNAKNLKISSQKLNLFSFFCESEKSIQLSFQGKDFQRLV